MEIARRLGAEMAEIVAQMGEPERKKEHTSFWLYTHTWRRLYFLVSHGNQWKDPSGMWPCVERTDQTNKRTDGRVSE